MGTPHAGTRKGCPYGLPSLRTLLDFKLTSGMGRWWLRHQRPMPLKKEVRPACRPIVTSVKTTIDKDDTTLYHLD